MKIVFLPYEHETIPMTNFAKSLRKKINHKQFFFISDFFSQISSNRYTNKIIKEYGYDDTQILDIYDEIKEISKIKENSKLINVDYDYLKNFKPIILLYCKTLFKSDLSPSITLRPKNVSGKSHLKTTEIG